MTQAPGLLTCLRARPCARGNRSNFNFGFTFHSWIGCQDEGNAQIAGQLNEEEEEVCFARCRGLRRNRPIGCLDVVVRQ